MTEEQIKGRLKNVAKENHADVRILMRLYMMERFEKVAKSNHVDNFIIEGGVLVTSMVWIATYSTMDIDTTIRNLNLYKDDVCRIAVQEFPQMSIVSRYVLSRIMRYA